MFLLNETPPTSIVVDNIEYTLFLEFDNVLNLFDLFNDDDLTKEEKFFIACQILFDEEEIKDLYSDLKQLEQLLVLVIDNFITGKAEKKKMLDVLGNEIDIPDEVLEEEQENEKIYDLKQDAEFIYASFLQDYGIDLHKERGKMHWITFQALLNGLTENTKFSKVVEIRTMELPSGKGMSKERERIRKLKDTYRLY